MGFKAGEKGWVAGFEVGKWVCFKIEDQYFQLGMGVILRWGTGNGYWVGGKEY